MGNKSWPRQRSPHPVNEYNKKHAAGELRLAQDLEVCLPTLLQVVIRPGFTGGTSLFGKLTGRSAFTLGQTKAPGSNFSFNQQSLLQQGKKPLSSVVPPSGQLLQIDIDMDFREWGFTVNIDSTGVPMVTSSAIPTLTTGDLLIEINGISMLDCSIEELEQAFGEVSTAQILVLRSRGKECTQSMEEACSLENALTELTNLQSEFIAATVELSALRNEKGVMWAEIEKLRARESLLLQENKRVLQSADSLKQLLERSEYRWMFLKEQLETMKGAFQLEKRKLDTVEAKLKEEIDTLKSKSCQDDKKIKDLATALKEKNAKSEQMKITQRHKYQVDITERNWLPEQLEELQMFGKQCQHLQHSHNQAQHPDQEWTYPQGQFNTMKIQFTAQMMIGPAHKLNGSGFRHIIQIKSFIVCRANG
ncbi:kinectin-like [Carcharodon carcharias]|uniref:kinectin-like n=1 Tax=Carcharodon carcharias TaxID=13397 RepID=UPI001B7F2578|nr:kinectin-like [Carcharodon carcharias]